MLSASLKPPPSLPAISPSSRAPALPAASFPSLLPSRGRVRLSAAASEGATVSQEDAASVSAAFEEARLAQFAADWKAVRADKDQGKILTLPVLRSNTGGLILKYNSMQGFVPNPLLSPAHWCKDPKRPIQDVTKDLVGSSVSVKKVDLIGDMNDCHVLVLPNPFGGRVETEKSLVLSSVSARPVRRQTEKARSAMFGVRLDWVPGKRRRKGDGRVGRARAHSGSLGSSGRPGDAGSTWRREVRRAGPWIGDRRRSGGRLEHRLVATGGAEVVEANEAEKKLVFSEKDASWSMYSSQVKIGGIYDGIVGSVFHYGAFVHLRFPDEFDGNYAQTGKYHLTGLVHISEVSWDLVQDVQDFLTEGDIVKVIVVNVDAEKSRIGLSIRQLEEDPLLETLDKIIPLEPDLSPDAETASSPPEIELLPGLDGICNELLQEDGITDVRFGRQALEKRVVSQDLELWLSSVPAKDNQYKLLARAGRQVQEVYLTTSLDQEGVKKARDIPEGSVGANPDHDDGRDDEEAEASTDEDMSSSSWSAEEREAAPEGCCARDYFVNRELWAEWQFKRMVARGLADKKECGVGPARKDKKRRRNTKPPDGLQPDATAACKNSRRISQAQKWTRPWEPSLPSVDEDEEDATPPSTPSSEAAARTDHETA
uniref:40S ribosomal protein S1 n=1 Tax=Aegilops tauschii TaxID=37682 RepID=M8C0S3_AEGTA